MRRSRAILLLFCSAIFMACGGDSSSPSATSPTGPTPPADPVPGTGITIGAAAASSVEVWSGTMTNARQREYVSPPIENQRFFHSVSVAGFGRSAQATASFDVWFESDLDTGEFRNFRFIADSRTSAVTGNPSIEACAAALNRAHVDVVVGDGPVTYELAATIGASARPEASGLMVLAAGSDGLWLPDPVFRATATFDTTITLEPGLHRVEVWSDSEPCTPGPLLEDTAALNGWFRKLVER